MSCDYSSFLTTEQFADVTLRCDSEVFRAHKVLLAQKSPVFLTMFTTRMKEVAKNYVLIKGVRPGIFRMVIKYIYSDNIPELDDIEIAFELMSAAHMYLISGLIKICLNFLKETISDVNCLTILKFADAYDHADVKDYAMNFISERFDCLKKDEQWETLRVQKPSLAMDVMNVTIDYLSKKNRVLEVSYKEQQKTITGFINLNYMKSQRR